MDAAIGVRPMGSGQAGLVHAEGLVVLPGTIRKATLTRFQALIDITKKVRSDNSFSENSPRTCS